MGLIPTSNHTSPRENLTVIPAFTSSSSSSSSSSLKRKFECATSTTSTTPESLKLHSDYLRNILPFLNKKDALSLKNTSKNLNIEVAQILNETHCPKILPVNIAFPLRMRHITLKGINMHIEAKEKAPSTLRVVNDAGHWDAAFIIHCLDKNKNKESYIHNKRTFLAYAADKGHLEVLRALKDNFDFTANDARANDNKALTLAAYKGHAEVLRVLKNEFGLTADDARYDNAALRGAALNGDVELLRVLKYEFGLTAADARAYYNEALGWGWAADEKVIEFFEKEWGLTLS